MVFMYVVLLLALLPIALGKVLAKILLPPLQYHYRCFVEFQVLALWFSISCGERTANLCRRISGPERMETAHRGINGTKDGYNRASDTGIR